MDEASINNLWAWVATAGLAVLTVITRAFFLIPRRDLPLPEWFKRGLRYAPLAALTAVIAPQIAMTDGTLVSTWLDARLPAVLCATLFFIYKRGILGTIGIGMAVYLPLHIGLGW